MSDAATDSATHDLEPHAAELTPAEIVAQLDLATKVRLLSGKGFWLLESVPEHGLDGIVVSDGPHGLRHQGQASDHLGLAPAATSTCFPTAASLGSTWDVELVAEVGGAIGEEALEQGVSVVLGPGVNLKRHPAGGRSFEYFSEDPLLGGRLAAAWVRGVQAHGVGASLKHYAVNNQESHRFVVDAVLDERTLRELYLTGFEIVVREAAPWTVMCSYNLVNGTYASEHHELLTTVLRDEWGFDGLVMSDWGAVSDRAAGIAAGLDLEMPGSKGASDREVLTAVADGRLAESAVDMCAERVVELLRRGRRDGAEHPSDRDEHHLLARRAAAAGSVLLRNEGLLPLPGDGRVAVVGAFAEHPRYQGAGSSQVNPTRLEDALSEWRGRAGEGLTVTYAPGYDTRTGTTSDALVDEAVAVAADADVVVLYAGLPAGAESEGFDRPTLDLPAGHVRLIEALAATRTPVVVVLCNGGAVHLPWADRVDAVLECWLGGQAGGPASVDVLLGDSEPGGRLAESLPVHVAQLPADRNFPGDPRQVEHREGLWVGYRFHDHAGVPARYPFGHGLSYTGFEWTDATLDGDGTGVEAQVTVTNTGARPGSEVVQVYVRDLESTSYRPDKELKGFAKVHLAPGESARVCIPLDRRSFAVWDVAAHDWLVEAGEFQVLLARSSVDVVATLTHTVASDDRLTAVPGPSRWVADDAEFAAMLGRAVPTPAPARPFHRNSTIEELSATRLGRLIAAQIEREGVKRSAEEFPDPDDATIEMVRVALRESPVRALVQLSGGMVPFAPVDALLDALNGDWSDAAGRVRSLLAARSRDGAGSPD
ncbi:MAG: glycoside hydrolase family 3 C-terminal domain-containing protein [Microthrixaceae bacterium]